MDFAPAEFQQLVDALARLRVQFIQRDGTLKSLREENEALSAMVRDRDRENAALNEKIRQLRYEACVQDEEKAALLKKGRSRDEQFRSLTDRMNCAVCLEKMEDPHVLGCGHTFCRHCLDNIRIVSDEAAARRIESYSADSSEDETPPKCPTCRAGFDSMTPDFALRSLVDAAQPLEATNAHVVPHASGKGQETRQMKGQGKGKIGIRSRSNLSLSHKMTSRLRYVNDNIARDPCSGFVKISQLVLDLNCCEDEIREVVNTSFKGRQPRFELEERGDGPYIRATQRLNDERRAGF